MEEKKAEATYSMKPQQIPYPSVREALLGKQSPLVHSLNGDWAFYPSENFQDTEIPKYSKRRWNDVSVPSSWDYQGEEMPATGFYRREFTVPPKWKKYTENLVLRMEGVSSSGAVWVNNTEVGELKSGSFPVEFNIGEYLKSGKNIVVIAVFAEKKSGVPGGLDQAVWLVLRPSIEMSDIRIRCDFDAVYVNAALHAHFTLKSAVEEDASNLVLQWYLYEEEDGSGEKRSLKAVSSPEQIEFLPGNTVELSTSLNILTPQKWSDEEPYLYTFVAVLADEEGHLLDVRGFPVGLRQMDAAHAMDGTRFRVNGAPVKLRGVNGPLLHPECGHAFSMEILEAEFSLMKQLNINALWCRENHTPGVVYEMADRLGLYVVNQMEGPFDDSSLITETMAKTMNHPCVILWCFNNIRESEKKLKAIREEIRRKGILHPLYFEGKGLRGVSDILVRTSGAAALRSLFPGTPPRGGGTVLLKKNRRKPIIIREPSRSSQNTFDQFMFSMMRFLYVPRIAGGFLRDFSDAAEASSPGAGNHFDGRAVSFRRKIRPEGEQLKALFFPVQVSPEDLKEGRIVLFNNHCVTDMNQYDVMWNMEQGGALMTEGLIRGPSVAPGMKKAIKLYNSLEAFPGLDEGFLNLLIQSREAVPWAAKGQEAARLQIPISALRKTGKEKKPSSKKQTEKTEWIHREQDGDLLIAGGGIGARIVLSDGTLDLLNFARENILSAPISPDISQEETLTRFPASGNQRCLFRRYRIRVRRNTLTVHLFFKDSRFVGMLEQVLIFHDGGTIHFKLRGVPKKPLVCFGLKGSIPPHYRTVQWYGLGPWECHRDSMFGALTSLYEMEIEEIASGSGAPGTTGTRAGVKTLSFSDGRKSVVFQAVENETLSFSTDSMESPVPSISFRVGRTRKHRRRGLTDYLGGKGMPAWPFYKIQCTLRLETEAG